MQTLLEKIRNKSFWIIDGIKGRKVKKHYAEIIKTMGNADPSSSEEKLNDKLEALIKHAINTVPFYKNFSDLTFNDFPITNKPLIKELNTAFLSNAFDANSRVSSGTSGSTGIPLRVFHDFNKIHRNSADTFYFAKEAGFSIGSKLVYMKIWTDRNKKSIFKRIFQNIKPVDVIKLDKSKIETLIKELESDRSTFGILGYSSALETLVHYLLKSNIKSIKANVQSIISMSESLSENAKTALSEIFNVQVVSRYSNIENGIIAQQELNGRPEYLINTASYLVEILDLNSDNPVKDGELGRIVVTDLYNRAMPMIRYDTDDLGAFVKGNKKYLARVEGRKLDQIYATSGDLVSSYIVAKNKWKYPEIVQYQLIQYGAKDFLYKIRLEDDFTKKEQMIKEFKAYLGEDANFEVKCVEEIPLLSSGKQRKIMNTFHT